MTNAYGVTIKKGCCSCSFNMGSEERVRIDSSVKSTACEYYGCSVIRDGKENCQYYNMKPCLWSFNPFAGASRKVKPKEYYDWLHNMSAKEYDTIANAVALNPIGQEVPKYSNMWKAWIKETPEGASFISKHPEMR